MSAPIPFVDLKSQYASIREEVDAAIQDVITNTAFVGGSGVADFEASFAAYCEAEHCVGVGNGTDALYLAMRALGLGAGDEIITVSNTFIATVEGITLTGATPIFVDIDPKTYLMDPALLEAAVTPKTKAIVAVHLYGQPVEMAPVMKVAQAHGLKVIEDAAQAHGARLGGQRVGGLADVSCFSFYPGKNLGAYGDAGAVVTNDAALAERVRKLSNHGRSEKYLHEMEGVNSRLDGLQAAVLGVKLKQIDTWNGQRRAAAAAYEEILSGTPGVVTPGVRDDVEPVWHLFVVQVVDREGLSAHLAKNQIACGIHYPVPLHLQPAYAGLKITRGALPVTEAVCDKIISLPIFPELGPEGAQRVAHAVAEFASTQGW